MDLVKAGGAYFFVVPYLPNEKLVIYAIAKAERVARRACPAAGVGVHARTHGRDAGYGVVVALFFGADSRVALVITPRPLLAAVIAQRPEVT